MSDARLKSLYRRLAATRSDATGIDADEIVAVLSRAGYPDQEGTPLDRLAGSNAHADIARIALALAPDAAALSHELARARAPRRLVPARRWLALAAGVGTVAILVAGLRGGPMPTAPTQQPLGSDVILSGSFEIAPGAEMELDEAAPIFRGDFDS
jgi:hypothetical protein